MDSNVKGDLTMENNTNQTISLFAILNAIKRNVLTIAYFLLTALLLGFIYARLQPSVYSSTARINSSIIITDTHSTTLTNRLNSDFFHSELVEELHNEGILRIANEEVTAEFLRKSISGGVTSKNAQTFDITFITSERDLAKQVVSITRGVFVDYMKDQESDKTIANALSIGNNASDPISLGISLKKAVFYAVILGGVVSLTVIFIKDVFSGYVYDKHDLVSTNVIQVELDKKFRKITRSNFMGWPVIPTNLKEAFADGDNKIKLEQLQDKIISEVGFDNNVQAFFSTTESKVHRMLLENYIRTFNDNGKNVLLINLDRLNEFNYKSKSLAEAINDNINVKNIQYLDMKNELYPSSVINSTTFINFIDASKEKYDYVLINGGQMIDTYASIISKLATSLIIVYAGETTKRIYNQTSIVAKSKNLDTVTIVVK